MPSKLVSIQVVSHSTNYVLSVSSEQSDDLLVVQLLVDKALEHPQVDHAEHLQ